MKHLGIMLCAVLLAAANVMAQARLGNTAIDVPFVFSVGGQLMPAGHYEITALDSSHVRIEGAKSHGLYASTHGALRVDSDESKVVFHKYGERYFLASIWVTGKTTGRELPRSQDERDVANRANEMQMDVLRPVMNARRPASTK